eukprot:Sdes_comp15032_c0_seq1m3803
MTKRLSNRGFRCFETASVSKTFLEFFQHTKEFKGFHIISCFNVLDRCDKPIQLLKEIHSLVSKNDGCVLLALVLPWSPMVETGTTTRAPLQSISESSINSYSEDHHRGSGGYSKRFSWENTVENIVENLISPCGFFVEKFSRVPYLCEGDCENPYYFLDDVIFLLKPIR